MSEEDEIHRIAEAFPPKPKCCSPDAKLADALAEHDRAMREEVIPEIERDRRKQALLVHYARLGIPCPEAVRAALNGEDA